MRSLAATVPLVLFQFHFILTLFFPSCFLRRRRKFMLWTLRIGTHHTRAPIRLLPLPLPMHAPEKTFTTFPMHSPAFTECVLADVCSFVSVTVLNAESVCARRAWEHSQARIAAAKWLDNNVCIYVERNLPPPGNGRVWVSVHVNCFLPAKELFIVCRFRYSCDSNRLTLFFSSPLAARSMHYDATRYPI